MPNVIKVENLSKRYRLGLKESRKDTLFAQIGHTLTAPIRNFKQLRSMTKFGQEDDSVFWALKDINFEVQQGEVLGIIGHNGAGKSTLLKLLSRITEPTTGSITLKGRVAALLEVGTGFHQDLTGRENIYMNGTILGMTRKEIDRKLDEIVDFSGVEKHLDTPVKFYSSGMKVRLGFAVAAHLEPEILIIDEVLAVGDAEFQKKCLGKMRSVAGEGRTVLFVSHNMAAVSNLCHKCFLLSKGKRIFQGETNETIKYYMEIVSSEISSKWNRTVGMNQTQYFDAISLCLEGNQPELTLKITFSVKIIDNKTSGFVAFDIKNSQGIPVMQAIPHLHPFVNMSTERANYQTFNCAIFLNGLVNDKYYVDAWLGPHNSETYDFQPDVVTFEVTESPTKGRNFPHSLDHGNIVPQSYLIKN
jgi:lipopolysaccharide transport system ATP-binding protein